MYQELKGRRAIILLRCSTSEQASTSLADQDAGVRAFAAQNGIIIIDVISLTGVSASIRANIDAEVAKLIARKRLKNDFDCILVYDPSRFARTGPRHSLRLFDDLDAAGVQVIAAMGYMPRNDFSDMNDVHGAFISREHAKRIASSSARGNQSSLSDGRRAHCAVAPFGIDKLIVSSDGRPAHRLRNKANGEQWRMHPETGEVLEVFPPNQPGQSSSHYRKAKEQKIQLVAGDPDAVAIVHRIYREALLERKGAYRIAKGLNDDGIPSPMGGQWNLNTILKILDNTAYLGQGICNRETFSIYYTRSPSMPAPVDVVPTTPSGQPARRVRPRSEWLIMEHPELKDFLPEDVRELARLRHQGVLSGNKKARGRPPAPAKDKHGPNEFILKGLLKSQQGGHAMTGISVKKKGEKYRYYGVNKGYNQPRTGSIYAKTIPAEPIEDAVRIAVRQMLLTAPLRRDAVIEQTLEWQREQRAGDIDRRAVERELAQVEASIDFVVGQVANLGKDEATRRLEKLAGQKQALQHRLAPVEGWEELDEVEVGAVVDAVLGQMQAIGRGMSMLPLIEQRRLVEMFLESAVVDLETKETNIVIRIPSWAAAQQRERGEVCLDSMASSRNGAEANRLCFAQIEMRLPFQPRQRQRKAA